MSILPLSAWPAMRRFHASLHSWTMSVAYLRFLASPEKAKVFSGLPSGICERADGVEGGGGAKRAVSGKGHE